MKSDSSNNSRFTEEELKKDYNSWVPEWNQQEVWNKLSDSLDFERELEELKSGMDFEEPVPPQVWNRLEASLEVDETDKLLRKSYEEWQPEPEISNWERLQESTLLEKTWINLKEELQNHPSGKSGVWIKVAALFALLILAFHTQDELSFFKQHISAWPENEPSSLIPQDKTETNPNSNQKIQARREGIFTSKKRIGILEQMVSRGTFSALVTTKDDKQPALVSENFSSFDREGIDPVNKLDFLNYTAYSPLSLALSQKSFPSPKMKKRIVNFGVNFFSTLSFVAGDKENALTSHRGSLGYEFGLLVGHPIKRFSQEYLLNYCFFHQSELGYQNGNYTQSDLHISGIKLSTVTKIPVLNDLSYGMGLSLFFPTQSVKERNNTIVEIPKTSISNIGFNAGIDYTRFDFSTFGKLFLSLKYEIIFPVNSSLSSQKNFQSLSLGIKYKI